MNYTAINLVYFSATGTTEKIITTIGNVMGVDRIRKMPVMQRESPLFIPDNEIAVFAVPVYSGRVPAIVAERFNLFSGNNTPAIIVAVYGNRDFDDALIELHDIVKNCGFSVISAGAFVAQHSIFPEVGNARPDFEDLRAVAKFGENSMEYLLSLRGKIPTTNLDIKGNRPYREIASIPLKPKATKSCDGCGACAKQCPVDAIDNANPKKTDKKRCISCAHCIAVCPKQARQFTGLLYKFASRKFAKKYADRKESYIVYR